MSYFKNLFQKKTEESKQKRAEQSRKVEEIKDQFLETHHNLEVLLDEIRNKKKASGDK